jgi:uncharacterized protein (TIGR03083 family)
MPPALKALRTDRDALVAIASGLSSAEWESPSGCQGWTTKDLVSHLASTFWAVVGGSDGPDTSGLGLEEAAALRVEARRSMAPADVLADYESVSLRALKALPSVASLDLDIPFGDAESYPASLLPAAFCFDHYTHIRADLFAPRGSLSGQPPPSDEMHLVPTLDWIEAAIPQQNQALVGSLPGRIELIVTGPGSRTILVGAGDPVATIESAAPFLVRWITQRARWEEFNVNAEGAAEALEAARSLKVY